MLGVAGWIGFLAGYAVLGGYVYNRNDIKDLSFKTNFFESTKLYWPLSVFFTVVAFIYFFLLSLRNGISDETIGWLNVFMTGAIIWPWTLEKGGEFSAILLTAVGSLGLAWTCDAAVRGAVYVLVAHHVGMDLIVYELCIRKPFHRTFDQRSNFEKIILELYVLYFGPLSGAWVWSDASGIIVVTVTGLHFVVGFLSTMGHFFESVKRRYSSLVNIVADVLIATGNSKYWDLNFFRRFLENRTLFRE